MKRIFAFLSAGALLVGSANAASIVWGAAVDNGFSLADGSNLGVGNLVRVGTFDINDSTIFANAGNIAFLNSHFIEFGNARIGDNLGFAEHFAKTSFANSGSGGLNIEGDQIYIWAFASADNTSVASSIATAFQLGIFYLESGLNSEWAIPLEVDPPLENTIDISDLSNGNVLVNGAHVVVGSFPNGTSDQPGNAPNFGLIVPEPSVATAVIASVGLLALRRRRRS